MVNLYKKAKSERDIERLNKMSAEVVKKYSGLYGGGTVKVNGFTLTTDDLEKAHRVEPLEQVIDSLSKDLKARHIQRVQAGLCTLELGFILNDCVTNCERVADHCSNLAIAVLELREKSLEAHDYLRVLHQGEDEGYRRLIREYGKKYALPAQADASK